MFISSFVKILKALPFGFLIGLITFWLTFYLSCKISPPFIVIDNVTHPVMAIGHAMISSILALIIGLLTIRIIFIRLTKKEEYSS